MLVRQKHINNDDAEIQRLLIESGVKSRNKNTRSEIKIEYTKMNRPSTYNLRSLLRRMRATVDACQKDTELRALNVRMEGTLINRAVDNSQVNATVFLDKLEEKYGIFFKPSTLELTIDYNHNGPVGVRDVVQTAKIIEVISKNISQVSYGTNVFINGQEIDKDDIYVIYLGGGLNYERIRKMYMALNKPFPNVTSSTFEYLYSRRHSTGQTLGVHCRRVLHALGIDVLDADRFFRTIDPKDDDTPAEVEFYSMPRHTLKISDVNRMYKIMSNYVYPDADTKYRIEVNGKLLLDAAPETMYEWMKNPDFDIVGLEFMRDKMIETEECSKDDFFEELYAVRPGWRPKYS